MSILRGTKQRFLGSWVYFQRFVIHSLYSVKDFC